MISLRRYGFYWIVRSYILIEESEPIMSKISEKRDAVLYYDALCRLLKIRESECPEVFRYYFERNGFKSVEKFVVIGDNDFFLRLAEFIAEDKTVSVTLLCDISKKNEFPLNQLDYCFGIMYLDLGSYQIKEILDNAVVLSDKRQIGHHAISYFDIPFLLNKTIKKGWVTKAALDKVYHYFKNRNINVLYTQIPSVSKLFPKGRCTSFENLNADEIKRMFDFEKGGGRILFGVKKVYCSNTATAS